MAGIDDITVMAALKHRMQYLSERQALITQNIANADTPGYKPHDLKKIDFLQEVDRAMGRLAPVATQPGHMNGTGGGTRFAEESDKDDFETTPSGNAVVLEEEALKMNKTATDYQTTTMLYRKLTDLMDMAIDGGKN